MTSPEPPTPNTTPDVLRHPQTTSAVDGSEAGPMNVLVEVTDKKQMELDLATARRRVDSALISGEIGTYEWDVLEDRLFGDANFERLFGIPLHEDGSAPLSEFIDAIHPEDRERTMARIRHTMETGAPYKTEYRIMSQGRIRWVDARGMIERDGDGKAVRFFGVLLDISERVQAEEARALAQAQLDEKSRILASVLSSITDFVYSFDRNGAFLFANEPLVSLWGLKPGDEVGKTFFDLPYPTALAEKLHAQIRQVFETGGILSDETEYAGPAGTTRTYEYIFTPMRGADGSVEVVTGSTRDISARKQAERDRQIITNDFRRLSSIHETVLSATEDFAYVFDRQGRFLYANRRLLEVWDKTLDQVIGKTCYELGYPDWHAAMHMREIAQVVETKLPIRGEVPFTGGSGISGIYDYIFTPTFTPDGEVDIIVGTTRDVTAKRQIEAALRQTAADREELLESERAARSEAEKVSQLKDDFLATLSHELRTPLNAILGWTQMLKAGDMDPDEMKEGLNVIERNTRIQTQLIEDLLDMSRIVAGKIRLDVQQLDIATVVQSALDTVRPSANLKNIRIKCTFDSICGAIMGDRNRLQQVVWNLLSNAIKFTPKEGLVQVIIERIHSHIDISVSDTGKGISEKFLPHVFDRFRQADSSTTRHHGGLGLGLSIVRQLVQLHGGEVSAKSQGEGTGATFIVSLPLAAVHAGARREEVGRRIKEVDGGFTSTDLTGVKVLAVDDEPDALELIARLLQMHDAEVRTANSMKQALEILEAFTPDVIVSDIGMPEHDGYELIKRVRALPNAARIPAVALTALARPQDKTRALRAGFQTHVTKPVEPAEILAVVASLFSLKA